MEKINAVSHTLSKQFIQSTANMSCYFNRKKEQLKEEFIFFKENENYK